MVGMTEEYSPQTGPAPSELTAPPLTRSRRHKVVGGVCGGLGRHYGMDPVIFRVPLALLSVIGGLGLVAYGVAWLLIPFEGESENEGRRLLSGRVEGPGLTALLFTLVGSGLFLASLGNRGGATWFSVMVLGSLAALAYWSRRRSQTCAAGADGGPVDTATAQAVADAPPEATAPPEPFGPSWWRDQTGRFQPAPYLWGPEDASSGDYRQPAPSGPERRDSPWQPPDAPAGPRPGPEPFGVWLGGLVLLAAVCVGVAGTAMAWGSQPLGTALVAGLSGALVVFGLGLALSAFVGRLGAGTIIAVMLTGVLLAGATLLPENISTSWSAPRWQATEPALVEDAYELGTGSAELDLSKLDLAAPESDGPVRTRLEAGAGQLRVLVPHDVTVVVHVELGAGAFTYEERRNDSDGMPTDSWGGLSEERSARYAPPSGVEPSGTIELTMDMGIGHVTIQRSTAPTAQEEEQ